MLNTIVVREMQIKTTTRYPFTPTRMAMIKKIIASWGEKMEKFQCSYTAGENVKWHSHSGKQYGSFSKSETQTYHMSQ